MQVSKNAVLAHIDAIINRQQQDLEELLSSKPRIKSQIERAKLKLSELRSFRKDLSMDSITNQRMLISITNDMKELGW